MNFVMDLDVEDFTLLVEQMLKKKHDDLEGKEEERFLIYGDINYQYERTFKLS